jgi:hypothetical protein
LLLHFIKATAAEMRQYLFCLEITPASNPSPAIDSPPCIRTTGRLDVAPPATATSTRFSNRGTKQG